MVTDPFKEANALNTIMKIKSILSSSFKHRCVGVNVIIFVILITLNICESGRMKELSKKRM